MREYKVDTPRHGTFIVWANSGTQAKGVVARMPRIRKAYPRLSIPAIVIKLGAHLAKPKRGLLLGNGMSYGRPRGSFNI